MESDKSLFLLMTGAGTVGLVPHLIRALLEQKFTLYLVLTPNVAQVTTPAPLMGIAGDHWIHQCLQSPLRRYPFGALLVALCIFNTFKKVALGLADSLATAMIADGIGAGCRTTIAPSMNRELWPHPQTKISLERLQSWGCEIIPPQIDGKRVTMATVEEIVGIVGKSL